MDASKPKKRDGGANVQKMRDCYYGQFLNGVTTRVIQKMQAKCGGSAVWDKAHQENAKKSLKIIKII